ncbi:hypothetical protein MGYG_08590 [Nannizzia gypsea CBS 118893]|uniref:Uncharacterized protein n=1 Tax=Arthroderma gypseum (strain ATCC MYA-4604 / CBS 118893) TaxID=535722 RepID=E4V6F1_ARTGP|nr:hypothetical protein MGYG_08590 [Nannizzia gypsea CBS 118893]EFQ96667.1 hypothetical protein MGYG_08590 [Nannizzia gypsea CBS 118893]
MTTYLDQELTSYIEVSVKTYSLPRLAFFLLGAVGFTSHGTEASLTLDTTTLYHHKREVTMILCLSPPGLDGTMKKLYFFQT